MSRKSAVLGMGKRGALWAEACLKTGWDVTGFDPDETQSLDQIRREKTISATVRGVDWIIVCLPERLELMQKVIQRAQAEAPDHAIIAVASRAFDVDQVQSCAIDPARVVLVSEGDKGLFFDITSRTAGDVRQEATMTLTELSAAVSLSVPETTDHSLGIESA